jgi:hypothetical protein
LVADLVLLDVISRLSLFFALFILTFVLLQLMSVLVEGHLVDLIIKLFLVLVFLVVILFVRCEGFPLFLHVVLLFLLLKMRPT